MTLARVFAVWGALLVVVTVHVSGQQQPSGPADSAAAIERGRYLVEQVAMCGECHSPRDAQGHVEAARRFRGGAMPISAPWPEWPLYIPRIAGLPGYTDEDAVRLLTQGAIGRKGQQLRLPMPRFRMTRPDAEAVIAYLRSL